MKKNMLNTKLNLVFLTGDVNSLKAECTDRRYAVLQTNEVKVRRPEAVRQAIQLQRQNPKLSDQEALSRAKAAITGHPSKNTNKDA